MEKQSFNKSQDKESLYENVYINIVQVWGIIAKSLRGEKYSTYN